jgi:uronate dehydrogenase
MSTTREQLETCGATARPRRILLTGAAGEIGTALRAGLAGPGTSLRLLDVATLPASTPGEQVELVQASVTDPDALRLAAEGVDAVVHLAALLGGHGWRDYLEVNVHGTFVLLEAARAAGVRRVVLASSHHAAGFHPLADGVARDYLFPRPDSLYGVTKVAMEGLGSLYHDRYGMDVICVRIASYRRHPDSRRTLGLWLSPSDCVRLITAALAAPSPGYRVAWGASANRRGVLSLTEAKRLGYRPGDDAEDHTNEIGRRSDDPVIAEYEERYLGGRFCMPDFDAAAELFR